STEQTISDLTFKTNILIPKLQEYIYEVRTNSVSLTKFVFISLIIKEISSKYPDVFQFEFLEELSKKNISSEILTELEDYLRYVQFQLYEKLNEEIGKRNELRQNIKDSIGNENFTHYINSIQNLTLMDYVSGKRTGKNYIENSVEILQTDDPIYRLSDNNYGRAHFLAPQKLMNGYYYDTIYFNMFILWLLTFLLYILTLILRKKSLLE
ncbi:MAG: hypothetical protein HC905_27000, partial [Bacteroidales bacterium]|nr:hypothetical protein [Bacteroidales bacterium]